MEHFSAEQHHETKKKKKRSKVKTRRLICLSILISICVLLLTLALFSFLYLRSIKHNDVTSLPEPTTFLLFGGSDAADSKMELLSIKQSDLKFCRPKIKHFQSPLSMNGAFGAFLDNEVTLCGHGSSCIRMDSHLRADSLVDLEVGGRQYPATVMYDSDRWWITGGRINGSAVSSTVVWHAKLGLSRGPELPDPRYGHCLVSLGSSRYFMAGGVGGNGTNTKEVFIMEPADPLGRWFRQSPMRVGREGAACGLIRDKKGQDIVIVAGGYFVYSLNSVELFSLSDMSWTAGPPLLEPRHYGVTIVGRSGSLLLLLLGGTDNSGGKLDSVIEFNGNEWKRRKEVMEVGRAYFTAIAVSSDWVNC